MFSQLLVLWFCASLPNLLLCLLLPPTSVSQILPIICSMQWKLFRRSPASVTAPLQVQDRLLPLGPWRVFNHEWRLTECGRDRCCPRENRLQYFSLSTGSAAIILTFFRNPAGHWMGYNPVKFKSSSVACLDIFYLFVTQRQSALLCVWLSWTNCATTIRKQMYSLNVLITWNGSEH